MNVPLPSYFQHPHLLVDVAHLHILHIMFSQRHLADYAIHHACWRELMYLRVAFTDLYIKEGHHWDLICFFYEGLLVGFSIGICCLGDHLDVITGLYLLLMFQCNYGIWLKDSCLLSLSAISK